MSEIMPTAVDGDQDLASRIDVLGEKMAGVRDRVIKTIEGLYITVAAILIDTFSEGVHRQMVHHLGKYIFA